MQVWRCCDAPPGWRGADGVATAAAFCSLCFHSRRKNKTVSGTNSGVRERSPVKDAGKKCCRVPSHCPASSFKIYILKKGSCYVFRLLEVVFFLINK